MKRTRRGLTLLEVLVSATLLSVGLLSALAIIGRSATTAREVEDRARALMYARSKMDEILKEPVVQIGTDRGEDLEPSNPYDWEASIEQSGTESLVLVTVLVRNRETGNQVFLTALRRPDVDSPLTEETTSEDGTTTSSGASSGAGGGQ